MKRFLFLILLLLPSLANAQWQEARMTPTMVGGGVAAASCNVSTDYLGTKTIGATPNNAAQITCYKWRPTCTGTSARAYLYNADTGTSQYAKLCVYNYVTDPPTASDTLVGCSAEITSANTDWSYATISIALDSTKDYYLCSLNNSTPDTWKEALNTTGGPGAYYSGLLSSCYASGPATLTNAGCSINFSNAANWLKSMYITIGP